MRVVGIHGIGQTFKGAAQLKPKWLAAIDAGLEEVKGPKLGDGDFAMVGFGPVFRPGAERLRLAHRSGRCRSRRARRRRASGARRVVGRSGPARGGRPAAGERPGEG